MRVASSQCCAASRALLAPSTCRGRARRRRDSTGTLAYVTVAGAPGDGEQALAAALSRQLAARGLTPADAFQANVYEVQGTVRVAPATKGKQSVTIVWVVLDPDGTQLGVTRQTQECAQRLARQEMGRRGRSRRRAPPRRTSSSSSRASFGRAALKMTCRATHLWAAVSKASD